MPIEKVFETPDPYLTAAIVCLLKIQPEYVVHGRKSFARFAATDDLYKAMGAFNAGCALPGMEFADAIKTIRAEFIRRRSDNTEWSRP